MDKTLFIADVFVDLLMVLMFWPQYEVVFRKLRVNGEVQQLFDCLHFTMNTLRRSAGYACYLDTQFIIDP